MSKHHISLKENVVEFPNGILLKRDAFSEWLLESHELVESCSYLEAIETAYQNYKEKFSKDISSFWESPQELTIIYRNHEIKLSMNLLFNDLISYISVLKSIKHVDLKEL